MELLQSLEQILQHPTQLFKTHALRLRTVHLLRDENCRFEADHQTAASLVKRLQR